MTTNTLYNLKMRTNEVQIVDVVGRVINMGVSKPTLNGSKFVEFHLLNERGRTIKVTLWGDIVRRRDALYVVLLPAMNIRKYNGTLLFDTEDVPKIALTRELLENGVPPSTANEGTLLQMLQLGREIKCLIYHSQPL